MATAGVGGIVRVFPQDGDVVLLCAQRQIKAHDSGVASLACLGGDVLVSGGDTDALICTWLTSSGECLGSVHLPENCQTVTAIAAVGTDCFVVTACNQAMRAHHNLRGQSGEFFYISHDAGRNLRVKSMAKNCCTVQCDINVGGGLIVITGSENDAILLSSTTFERVSTLGRYGETVKCAAVGKKYIATASIDNTPSSDKSSVHRIRVYENAEGFALVRVLVGLHVKGIKNLVFITDDLLLSSSSDGVSGSSLYFTALSSCEPLARVDIPMKTLCTLAVLPDGRIVCGGSVGKKGHLAVLLSTQHVISEASKGLHVSKIEPVVGSSSRLSSQSAAPPALLPTQSPTPVPRSRKRAREDDQVPAVPPSNPSVSASGGLRVAKREHVVGSSSRLSPEPAAPPALLPTQSPTPVSKSRKRAREDDQVPAVLPSDPSVSASEPATSEQVLKGHTDTVNAVTILPDSNSIATACEDGRVRVFRSDGTGDPQHDFDGDIGGAWSLAALGCDVIVSGGYTADIFWTWLASGSGPGKRLESVQLGECGGVTGLAVVSDGCFVVGTISGKVFFLSHSGGRELAVLSEEQAGCGAVLDISAGGGVVVAGGSKKKASVLSATTRKRLCTLGKHQDLVQTVDVSEHFIATGSRKTVTIYQNAVGYALERVLEGQKMVKTVSFLANDIRMSASKIQNRGSCVRFTSLSSSVSSEPLACVDVALRGCLAIAGMTDGRLVCVGEGEESAVIVSPPSAVVAAVNARAVAHSESSGSVVSVKVEKPQIPIVDLTTENPDIDLEKLKESSLKADVLKSMSVETLAQVVAGAMICFLEEFQAQLFILAGCLRTVFRKNGMAGDTVVSFPEAKVLRMIVDGLREDSIYTDLGENATDNFEWRLKRFLHDLRLE